MSGAETTPHWHTQLQAWSNTHLEQEDTDVTDAIATPEDPAALDDYHNAHMAERERDRLRDALAASLSRGMWGNFLSSEGNPEGEATIMTWAVRENRPLAAHLLNDPAFEITLNAGPR